MDEKFKLIASVYLLFKKDDSVLLLRRTNTGYEDGKYGLVAGHLDAHEPLTNAAIREAKEEAGIDIKSIDLILRTVMHRRQEDERTDFFFEPLSWVGELKNMEPNKCDDLRWFPIENLPENTIPYIKQAIECWQKRIFYSEFGWEKK